MVTGTLLSLLVVLTAKVAGGDHRLVYFDGHIHTHHSDGSGSIADVKAAAVERGLNAVIVTNHTGGLRKEVSPGVTHWDRIVATCRALSEPDFLMIPSFEITGREGQACRDHMLAWGVKDPFVGDDSLRVVPEAQWDSPGNAKGTGPLKPESIAAWAEYIHTHRGIAVHAHPTGTTQPEYGVDCLEVWNYSHVKDVVSGCLAAGLSVREAWMTGVLFNNTTTVGEDWLFENVSINNAAVQTRLAFHQSMGAWLGKSRDHDTPSGTPANTWDALLMLYLEGDLAKPIFGVANSDAHNTAKVDFTRTDPSYDHSDVGEAKNGVMIRGEFNETNLLRAIKGGHFFATLGPSMEFDVNGKIMGETVQGRLSSGEAAATVNISLQVNAEKPGHRLQKIKLIKNGVVLLEENPQTAIYETTLTDAATEDCYYRVEVTAVDPALAATDGYPYLYAWGNPVFLRVR